MEELGRRFRWASLPLVALIVRLLCKELTLQVQYLRKEVEVFRSKLPDRTASPTRSGGRSWTARWPWAGGPCGPW
jgi:hypothetical protein